MGQHTDRLKTHCKRGWTVVALWEVSGETAIVVERATLQWLRGQGVPTAVPGYLDGATETFPNTFPEMQVRAFIDGLCSA